jgi:hypothetical protein
LHVHVAVNELVACVRRIVWPLCWLPKLAEFSTG